MFDSGEKVICVNDTFSALARRLYDALPVKDHIYTVRYCGIGRTKTGSPDKGVSYKVLLVGVINGPDPYMNPDHAEELGFRSDRFAPLQELETSAFSSVEVPAPGELVEV